MNVHRFRAPQRHYLFVLTERDRPRRTDTGTHWLQAFRRTVIAHIALHLQMHLRVVLRHAEGAGVDAVPAIETAWLQGGHHHAIVGNLDRIGGANQSTGWLLTMHAKRRHRGGCFGPVEVVDKNHGIALVRAALATGGDAGAAADAALRIDEHGLFHNYLRVRQPDRKGINPRTALLNKSLTLMSQSISCEAAARAK